MIEIEKYYKSFKLNFKDNDIVKNNVNDYLSLDYSGFFYIRNFCTNKKHFDIDEYFSEEELVFLNSNIFKNSDLLSSNININDFSRYSKAIIINSKIDNNFLKEIKNNKCLIIGINDSLKYHNDLIDLYICNNPYRYIINFLPKDYTSIPIGLFSYRTNHDFIKFYKGTKYSYNTPPSKSKRNTININSYNIFLEDHRCLILSIFNLIYYFGIRNVFLLNTENYIREERSGVVYIKEGVYMYPQQIIESSIISAGAYWLKKYGINTYTYNKNFNFIDNIIVYDKEI